MNGFTNFCYLIIMLALFFLFWGEPDVWDAMHAKAMSGLTTVCEEKP